MSESGLAAARLAAAQHLEAQGYPDEAAIVTAGQGDAFAEVRIALSLWKIMTASPSPPLRHRGRRLLGEEC